MRRWSWKERSPLSPAARGASGERSPRPSSARAPRSSSTGATRRRASRRSRRWTPATPAIFVAGDAKINGRTASGSSTPTVEHVRPHRHHGQQRRGASNHAPVVDLTDEAFDDALRWNLWSTFWCTRRSLQHMIPQKSGRIINVSSLEGKCGKPGVSIYVTAKHAINGLTKSCAHEVGTLGHHGQRPVPGRHRDRHHGRGGAQGGRGDGDDLPGLPRLVRQGIGDQAAVRGRGRRRTSPCCWRRTPAPASPAR